MVEHVAASFVTTTSYGSWLPGDARSYVESGVLLPPSKPLAKYAANNMKGRAVSFNSSDRDQLHQTIAAAAAEFGYKLSDLVIEETHLHWILSHDDPMATMVGRLKARMRQRLNRGRIWTEGYCGCELRDLRSLYNARNYLAQHAGLLMLAGEPVGTV